MATADRRGSVELVPGVALAFLTPVALYLVASTDAPAWIDSVSRIGVIGILALALYGLHRRWWVPGWAYRDLEERHRVLRGRYDSAIDIALRTSRGVERTASVLEQAIAAGSSRDRPG